MSDPHTAPGAQKPGQAAPPDPRVLAALTGGDAVADRALSLRTRRTVYKTLVARRTERQEDRRRLSIAFAITAALAVALAPAIWAGFDDMLGGETLLDLPGMLVALGITMCAAMAAVLSLVSQRRPGTTRDWKR